MNWSRHRNTSNGNVTGFWQTRYTLNPIYLLPLITTVTGVTPYIYEIHIEHIEIDIAYIKKVEKYVLLVLQRYKTEFNLIEKCPQTLIDIAFSD